MRHPTLILVFLASTLACGCGSAQTPVVAAYVSPALPDHFTTTDTSSSESLETRYASAFRRHLATVDLTVPESLTDPYRSDAVLRGIWLEAYRRAYERCGDFQVWQEEVRTVCSLYWAPTPEARAKVLGIRHGTADGVRAGSSILGPILEQHMEEVYARAGARPKAGT
jgi:hypothetical protein